MPGSDAGGVLWSARGSASPKLPLLSRFDCADLGFHGLAGLAGVYVRVRGMGAPIRSKAPQQTAPAGPATAPGPELWHKTTHEATEQLRTGSLAAAARLAAWSGGT